MGGPPGKIVSAPAARDATERFPCLPQCAGSFEEFHVQRIDHSNEHFTLHAVDGRSVQGTPGQFLRQPRVLPEDCNPDHDAHLEEALMATPSLPAHDAPRSSWPPVHDELLGDIVFDDSRYEYGASFAGPDGPLEVVFDCAGPEQVRSLLPHVRRDVLRSGDYAVHFGDSDASYFMEGYWLAVHYRSDEGTPVMASVEA
jgi:hypothetical protein